MKFKLLTLFVCVVVLCSCLVIPSFADDPGASADGFDPSAWAYKYTITYNSVVTEASAFDVPDLYNNYYGPFYVVANVNGVIFEAGGLDYYGMDVDFSNSYKQMSFYLYSTDVADKYDLIDLMCSQVGSSLRVTYGYYPVDFGLDGGDVSKSFTSLDLVSFEIYTQDEMDLSAFSAAWVVDVSSPSDDASSGPVTSVTSAWTGVLGWLVASISSVQLVFYNDGFTFLGVLALIGIAIVLAFLLIAMVQKFLKLGG